MYLLQMPKFMELNMQKEIISNPKYYSGIYNNNSDGS